MKTGSPTTASIPSPTPFLILVTALAFYFWPDGLGITTLVVATAIVVPAFVAWFSSSPKTAIVLLLVASAVPRLYVEILGSKARPEHIISGLMIFAIPLLLKKRSQPVQWMFPDYCLMGYIALNLLSSLLSVAPSLTLKWAMQQVLAIVPYFLLRILIGDRERFQWAFRMLLLVGAMACAYAIFCFYCNVFFGTQFGVEVGQYGDIAATYGLQFEANILGAYSAALAIMMLVMYLFTREKKYLIGCTFLGLVGMAISLSRAALGAAVVISAIVLYAGHKREMLNKRVLGSIVWATFGAFLLIAPLVVQHYTERFSTVEISDPTADPNTLTRAVQTITAFDEILKHPILGGGTASFQLAFDWRDFGAEWEVQGWIGNTEMRVLHDTGVVGLLVFGLFVASLAHRAWKAYKLELSPELMALMVSLLVYCLTFQATEGTLLGFSWAHLGLTACGASVIGGSSHFDKRGQAQIASS